MKLTVIGLGLIGGSMAIDLRKSHFATEIIGIDNRPEHAAEALELGIVDQIADLESGVKAADLVLLACLLYTSPSPRDRTRSRMPSSA